MLQGGQYIEGCPNSWSQIDRSWHIVSELESQKLQPTNDTALLL